MVGLGDKEHRLFTESQNPGLVYVLAIKSLTFSSYIVLGELKKNQLARCNSHNAYKCFGECRVNNCNTHFQTEDGLKQHISKSRTVCHEVRFTISDKTYYDKINYSILQKLCLWIIV